MGQWRFSVRRANIHLVDTIASHGGCIIVDSTRRGKRIPDALSKTVPIWCSTINRAVNKYCRLHHKPTNVDDLTFYSLPSAVSSSEHAQIESRIEDIFVQELLDSGMDMEHLANVLKKPLRPIWMTPHTPLHYDELPDYDNAPFYPVLCVSASQQVDSGCQIRPGYIYVQGSADDQEAWSLGLTNKLFWRHRHVILNVQSATECESKVKQVVDEAQHRERDEENGQSAEYDFIEQTSIAVGNLASGKPPACWSIFDVVINCTDIEYKENKQEDYKHRYLQLPIPKGKKASTFWANAYPLH